MLAPKAATVQFDAANATSFLKEFERYGTTQCSDATLKRAAEPLWKALVLSDTNEAAQGFSRVQPIEVGRSVLSEQDKWKLKAWLRREETTTGGTKYNKKVMKATAQTLGPGSIAPFPPGRGKPPAQ